MLNKLIFKDAWEVRDQIDNAQRKKIAGLYKDWADELEAKAKKFDAKSTLSAPMSAMNARELKNLLIAQSNAISQEVDQLIRRDMYVVADAVVKNNVKWLEGLGFGGAHLEGAFANVPTTVVENLVSGKVYQGGWSLSQRIWGDNEDTLSKLYEIVGAGRAQNLSTYEITKQLEQYVRPGAKKQWNLKTKDGKRIYPKKVDYNAQRLARTLSQHAYQQSFIATIAKNPMIPKVIWWANGSRVCKICLSLHGQKFDKDKVPLDHPNGMCVLIPDVNDNIEQQIADWVNAPDGTFPEIDEFASNFGYKPNITSTISLSGGRHDPVLTDSIHDYFLPKATRGKLDEIESLKTYSDFEEYFTSKGITLDTDLVKLKENMRHKEIEAVESLCQKIVTGVEAYEDTFGPEALSKLNKIILYDESLDVKAAYHFNRIGENDPFAGTIRFSQWSSDGREVFHELAHAFQDSNALPGEDAVSFASRMVKEANLAEDFKAYFGADKDVMDAERFADAFGFGFGRGMDVGIEFIKRVGGVIK